MTTSPDHLNESQGPFLQALGRLLAWRTFRRLLIILAGLVTAVALLWTEERVRGRHAWEAYKQQWEAKGEHFDLASFTPPPVPDDQNFYKAPIWTTVFQQPPRRKTNRVGQETRAGTPNNVGAFNMHPYNEAIKADQIGNWLQGTLTDLGSPAAWEQYFNSARQDTNSFQVPSRAQSPAKNVLLVLRKFDPTIDALHQAAQRPFSRVPVDYGDVSALVPAMIPLFVALKTCIRVLQLRSVAELADNQTASALNDIQLMFRLADSIRSSPMLIPHLVRLPMVSATLQPIYEGLAQHRWNDTQLESLEDSLAKEDILADCLLAMRGERAFGIALAGSLPRYSLNPFQHQYELAFAQMAQRWILPAIDLKARLCSPATVKRLQEDEAATWKKTTLYNILAKMAFPAVCRAATQFAEAQVGVDLARTACALERYRLSHGQYPETLDALSPQFISEAPHDIINAKPLQYRRTNDGRFALYSIGWNDSDDRGSRPAVGHGQTTESGDWVWEYPAK